MDLVVAADDRTGALEVAGRLADAGNGPITVTAWPDVPGSEESGRDAGVTDRVVVVDLGSRHLSQREARDRATSLTCGARSGHKIDSALRGNWADELAGRAERCPVLLVPALPEFGRVCVGGEVLEHGRPVHEGSAGTDVRRRLTSSRPSTLLRSAGAHEVDEVAGVEQLRTWLAEPSGVVIADAQTDDEIAALVDAWQRSAGEVLLAGPSSVVGLALTGDRPVARLQLGAGPVLVVCGSVHPLAREQLAFAERRGMPVTTLADDITARQLAEHGSLALVTEIPVGDVDEPLAVAAAAGLARGVADLRDRVDLAALVIIGGDTAAAILGARPAVVHGTAGAGTAWATLGDDPLPVITRSGGFGSDAALDELLRDLPRP